MYLLLVDPDEEVAEQFRAAAPLALAVKAVACSREAWVAITARCPLAVVSEYGLPGPDGLSLLQRVGERYPAVKRILHTRSRPRPAWGQDIPVLGKPCDPEALRELLRALLHFAPLRTSR